MGKIHRRMPSGFGHVILDIAHFLQMSLQYSLIDFEIGDNSITGQGFPFFAGKN
jgi:hypothetical protein